MLTSPEINQIAEALAASQSEFRNPEKNREVAVKTNGGGEYRFSYATLDQVLDIVRPILSKNKIAFVQVVDGIETPSLVTRLIHASGQWIESSLVLSIEKSGNQGLGSAITYLRRYGLISLLGLAAEEDDDGNQADGNQAQGRDRQPAQQRPAANRTSHNSTKPAAPTVPPSHNVDNVNALYKGIQTHLGPQAALCVWKAYAKKEQVEERYCALKAINTACVEIIKTLGSEHGARMIQDEVDAAGSDAISAEKVAILQTRLVAISHGEKVGAV